MKKQMLFHCNKGKLYVHILVVCSPLITLFLCPHIVMTVKPPRILNVRRQTNGCPLSNYKAYDRHCRILFINSNNVAQGGHKCLFVLIHR